MRVATLALTLAAVLAATGCSRFGSDSGLNPLGWMGGGSTQPTTLEPKGGWKTEQEDGRQLVPQILSAGFQPLTEGKLLVVRAFAPVKGWWHVELISARVQPAGQMRPDDDGILRLRLVGNPPLAGSPEAQMPANLQVDVLNVALPLSTIQLSRLRGIEIQAASGGVSMKP